MTSYMMCCLLFTEILLGPLPQIESQSTMSEVTATATILTSTDKLSIDASLSSASTFEGPGSSSLKPDSQSSSTASVNQSTVLTSISSTTLLNNNVISPEVVVHNSSTSAASPTTSSLSSTTSHNLESTKQTISFTAFPVTTNFTGPTQSSKNETSVMSSTTSDASSNVTVLSSTTITTVNTAAIVMSNARTGSSQTPTTSSVSFITNTTIVQTNSSVTHSTVPTSNNSSSTTASPTSHQTLNATVTARMSNSTDAAVVTSSTTHSVSTSAVAVPSTNANFTAGQSTSTIGPVTFTVTSDSSTLPTTETVTVETISPSISSSSSSSGGVTSYSVSDRVSFSSAGDYSTADSDKALGSAGGSLGWVAGPVIGGILLIVVITVIVLLVLRRRQRKQKDSRFLSLERRQKEQPGGIMNPSFRIDTDDSERAPPSPVPVDDFVNHVAQLHRDSDYGFASEFTALNKLSPQNSKSAAELPENRTKNRFTNILPYDHSRVKLIPADDDENGGSDYINASFLPGFSSRREFIAAQGPMKSTVDDFWRMIWEYNVTTVVMVTNLFERGREKCVQYWPEQNEPIYYGDIQVELKSESSLNYYIIRVLNVTLEQKSRRVMHYQFLTWPDFGVPKEHSHLLSFLTQVRSSLHPTTNQPVLVHCSAGVGRTGTFILIDHVLQLIRRNADINLFDLVLDMRNYRSHMIQTEAQYIFAHECIRNAIELGYHQGRDICSDDTSAGETQHESLYANSGQTSN